MSAVSFPKVGTVAGDVLADFLRAEHLTHGDVWQRHGSSRLAHHALTLRSMGWPLTSERIKVRTCRGRSAFIARYTLPPEAIVAAGERGRDFVARVRASRSTGVGAA